MNSISPYNPTTRRMQGVFFYLRIFVAFLILLITALLSISSTHAAGAPIINSVLLDSGFTTGGDSVVITGENFDETATVRFGDDIATSVTWQDSNTLVVVTPAHTSGTHDVIVTNAGGERTILASSFTFRDPAPVISSVSPDRGTDSGGRSVTISGENLTVGVSLLSNISTGYSHTCGVYDGKAYCWGLNTSGQLGNGSVNAATEPTAVDTSGVLAGKTIGSISAGATFTCATTTDGAVYCWGDNALGQLGDGTATSSLVPVATTMSGVLAGKSALQISSGYSHACIIANDEQGYCWGHGSFGQLGNGATANSQVPVAVLSPGVLSGKTLKKITTSGGNYNTSRDLGLTCAIASDDKAYCWGTGMSGAIGNGATTSSNSSPIAVDITGVLADKTLVDISAGGFVSGSTYANRACVVDSEGAVYCWGYGGNGEMGNGTTTLSNTRPVAVDMSGVLSGKKAVSVSVGSRHVCVSTADEAIYCWGYNLYGALGNGVTNGSNTRPVATTMTGVLADKIITSVSAGGLHTCVTTANREGYCWGQNSSGQIGIGTTDNALAASAVQSVPVAPLAITFGDKMTSVVHPVSSTEIEVDTPEHASGIVDIKIDRYDDETVTASSAYTFTAAPTIDSISPNAGLVNGGDVVTIQGSGFDSSTKIRINATYLDSVEYINETTMNFIAPAWQNAGPVDITAEDALGGVVVVASGYTYSDPAPTISSISPNNGPVDGGEVVTISGQNLTVGVSQLSNISAGLSHSCGIYDGKAYCWGANNTGQLGNGSVNATTEPTAVDTSGVLTGKTIRSLSAGRAHTCAITTEDRAYCWGYNNYGQIGDGTTTTQLSPAAVMTTGSLSGKAITEISSGYTHTCALSTDGLAYCWGSGSFGQLGAGSTSNSSIPVAVSISGVLAGKSLKKIATSGGEYQSSRDFGLTCALDSDGLAYCWGFGSNGALGTGVSLSYSTSPVTVDSTGVLAGKTLVDISAGGFVSGSTYANHACVLDSEGKVYCWGYGGNGEMGNGTVTTSNTRPVAVDDSGVLAGKRIINITTSTRSVCALASDNTMYCWGHNLYGQIGNGTTAGSLRNPVAVTMTGELAGEVIADLEAGGSHACVETANRKGYCWGLNTSGQLGNGSTDNALLPTAVKSVPVALPVITFGAIPVAAVESISSTELRVTTPAHSSGLVDVQLNRYDGESVVASNAYTYAAKPKVTSISPSSAGTEGGDTVTISGENFSENAQVQFNNILLPAENVTYINQSTLQILVPSMFAGQKSIRVINQDGQDAVLKDAFTVLEAEMTFEAISPNAGPLRGGQTVSITGSNFSNGVQLHTHISSGSQYTCSIIESNKAYCWGSNNHGQLGIGSTVNTFLPSTVDATGALLEKSITKLSAGYTTTCSLTAEGQAYCWGEGDFGALGNGKSNESAIPVAVDTTGVLNGKNLTEISVAGAVYSGATSFSHACALDLEGKAYCWGYGSSGAMGNGVSTSSNQSPVEVDTTGVLNGKVLTKISAGAFSSGATYYGFTCALDSEGKIYCWGRGTDGTMGNGTVTSINSKPVAVDATGVLADKSVKDIAAGGRHACALTTEGGVYCWGYGANGQLGSGDNKATNSTPIAVDMSGVLAGKTVRSITAGAYHTCALTTEGEVYCWGVNTSGQLGTTAVTDYSLAPIAVDLPEGLQNVQIVEISAGTNNTCAVTAEGKGYCWGANNLGQLGDGTTTQASIPVEVSPISIRPLLVTFNGVASPNVEVVSSEEIHVTTPQQAVGFNDVQITRYDDDEVGKNAAYEYIGVPIPSSVTPSTGLVSGGDTITIRGDNFREGNRVKVGAVYASDVIVVNDTTITATVPVSAVPGAANVTVEDEYSQSSTLSGAYTYLLATPTLTSVTPNIGSASSRTTVTIQGSGFVYKEDGDTWYSVLFDGTAATNVTYIDENTLRAVAPTGSVGMVDVTVRSEYMQDAVFENGYTYVNSNFAFTNSALSLATDEYGKLTVTSRDGYNQPKPSPTDITVSLSSDSLTGKFAIDLSEDESTRWEHSNVVLPAGQSSVSVWYKDPTTGTPRITGKVGTTITFSQLQTITSPYRFQVSGITSPIKQGEPSSVTVRVVDRNGVQRTDYTGTLHFTSNDPAARLPQDYTMKASDYGIKTFTNGVTLGSIGSRCVTVRDTLESSATGQQCSISVQQANEGVISKLAITTPEQRVTAGQYSAPITIQSQDSVNTPIPVSADTPVYLYSSGASGQFSLDGETWSTDSPFVATIAAGTTSLNVYYKDDVARTATLSARDLSTDVGSIDSGWKNTSQKIVTGLSPPAKLGITGVRATLPGTKNTYSIELQDEAGNPVSSSSDVTVRVDSTTATTRFYLAGAPNDALTGPIEFIIPAGFTSTTIMVSDTTLSEGEDLTTLNFTDGRPVTETARLQDGNANLRVVASMPSHFELALQDTSARAGQVVAATIRLLDDDGQEVVAVDDTLLRLGSSTATGEFSLINDPFTPVTDITFASGESQKTFFFRESQVGSTTVSATNTELGAASDTLSVTAGDIASFKVSPAVSSVALDTVSDALTVSGYDIYGNITPVTEDTSVYLYSSEGTTKFSESTDGPWDISSITIPEGQTSAQFYLRDSQFHDEALTITASDKASLDTPDIDLENGVAQVTIVSQPIDTIEITSQEQTITAGAVSQAITVSLQQADGSPAYQDGTTSIWIDSQTGEIIAQAGDNPDTQHIQALTIGRNQASATFYYVSKQSGTFAITVSTDADGVEASQSIIVEAAAAHQLRFVTAAQSVPAGSPSQAMRVAVQDQYGNITALSDDTTLQLASLCENGAFSENATEWQSVETIDLSSGASDATFYYRSFVKESCTLTASIDGLIAATQNVTVTAGSAPVAISIASPTDELIKGAAQSVAINLLDEYGNIAPAVTSMTVRLSTNSTDAEFNETTLTFPVGMSSQSITFVNRTQGEVTITARDQESTTESADSMLDASATLVYVDGEASRLRVNGPSTAQSGDTVEGTIQLANLYNLPVSAAEATTVTLSSATGDGSFMDAAGNTVTTLKIEAGQSQVAFKYRQTVSESTTLTAQANGLTTGTLAITFVASDSLSEMRFINQPYIGSRALEVNTEGTYQVGLYDEFGNIASYGSDITLHVSTTGSGALSDEEVVIPAGQSTATFTYEQSAPGNYSISVSDAPSGDTGMLGTITQQGEAVAGMAQNFRFTPPSITLERGAISSAVAVELLSATGQPIASKGGSKTVLLTMKEGQGRFSLSKNGSYASSMYVTVREGDTSAKFYYRNDTGNPAATHSIQASGNFLGTTVEHELPVTLQYGEPVRLAFTTIATPFAANSPSATLTVQQQNQYGVAVPAEADMPIYLRSNAQDSSLFGSSKVAWGIDSVVMKQGSSSVDFYYQDSQEGTPTITAADSLPLTPDLGLTNATQQQDVRQAAAEPREIDNFLVTNISDPQKQGTHSSVVVIARDVNGYVVSDYEGTVHFTSDDPEAILPQDFTFRRAHKGVYTFRNSVAFRSLGEKTITVTDEAGHTGSQVNITVTDGNSAPVDSIAITQPVDSMTIAPNTPSPFITVELHDADGNPTVAPSGGMLLNLSTSSATGELSQSVTGPWQSSLSITIPSGLSFATVYYKDGQPGEALITASAPDTPQLPSDSLQVLIQKLALESTYEISSRGALGEYKPSAYLFAHTADGQVEGALKSTFESYQLADGAKVATEWRTQWRQGVTLIGTSTASNLQSLPFTVPSIKTTAGANDFYAIAEATDTTFADAYSVVSKQVHVPVSPWRTSVSTDTHAVPSEGVPITAAFTDGASAAQPASVTVWLVPAAAKDTDTAIYQTGILSPESTTRMTLPLDESYLGDQYRVVVATYDTDGNTTSEVASQPIQIVATMPEEPAEPGDTGGTPQLPGTTEETPPSGSQPSTESPVTPPEENEETPTAPGSRPSETPAEFPPLDSAVSGRKRVGAITAESLVTYGSTTIVIVLLLREAYKEWARVRRIRAVLRREQQLAVDKNTFLSLSAHYLRTPITILDAASSMVPAAQAGLTQFVASLRQKANALLEAGENGTLQQIQSPDIVRAMRSAYRSIFFWLPIVISVILTIAVLILFDVARTGTLNNGIVYAGIIAVSVALVGFFGARTVYINREIATMKQAMEAHRAALFDAKTKFINDTQRELAREVAQVQQIIQSTTLPAAVSQQITESIGRLNDLLAKLSVASGINGVVAQPRRFSPRRLAESTIEYYRANLAAKRVKVATKLNDGDVQQDERLLSYVTSTVLDNAIKFSQADSTVELASEQRRGITTLSITNTTSSNLSDEVASRMFEPFNHAANPDDLTAEGMGLSLYLDKLVMEHLGGSIEAENDAQKKTVAVRIRFPSRAS